MSQAYVRFASADEAQRAIARDCAIFSERFGQRYVHVYGLATSDMGDLQATALAAAEFEAAAQVGTIFSIAVCMHLWSGRAVCGLLPSGVGDPQALVPFASCRP